VPYPRALESLVEAFERFPGVGRRTAERLAFHALRAPEEARELEAALAEALGRTLRCGTCFHIAEEDTCARCRDSERDVHGLLVVEEPKDVEAVERSGVWQGHYHVLMGALNPAEGTSERHLSLAGLVRRLKDHPPPELVLGTDPDAEGEATALLVLEALEREGLAVPVTRLARGLPAGVGIEYLHRGVLEDALEGRVPVRARQRGQSEPTGTSTARADCADSGPGS